MTEPTRKPLDWSAFTRRPPTLRKGVLIRLQDGSIARIKKLDQATNEFELEPAPRFVVWVRRAIGKWDRRERKYGDMVKGHSVSVTPGSPLDAYLQKRTEDEHAAYAAMGGHADIAGVSAQAWAEHLKQHQRLVEADLVRDGADKPPAHPWWSRLLCRVNLHDWRDGPGEPCTVCGAHDWLFCSCEACTRRRRPR